MTVTADLPDGVKRTPMLEQYMHWKKKYPDCLLFFRMGDFYEMFFDDAKIAASVLDIVLTARDKDKAIPMAGVPYHSMEPYLARLIEAGYRVAICEQMSEPDGKTLVERDVIRVVTPGTWISESSGSEGRLAALAFFDSELAVALLSSTTGRFEAGAFPKDEGASLLFAFSPEEILYPRGQLRHFEAMPELSPLVSKLLERDREEFSPNAGTVWLCRRFDVSTLRSMGIEDASPPVAVAASALRYLEETQFTAARHVTELKPLFSNRNLILDEATIANLELVNGQTPGSPSLYSTLDRTRTAMGRRALKSWILHPSTEIETIERRQDCVEALVKDERARADLAENLSACADMERALGRLSLKMGGVRDLGAVRDTLKSWPDVARSVSGTPLESCFAGLESSQELFALRDKLDGALAAELPRHLRDGGAIRPGYDARLDEWRSQLADADAWICDYESRERERVGVRTLRVSVNRVFGYYIEMGKAAADKLTNLPADYVRRQTLVNAERFITPELKDFENTIFGAEDAIATREQELYDALLEGALTQSRALSALAEALATVDVLGSFAQSAVAGNYVRPRLARDDTLHFVGARHPVVERCLGTAPFTPNDLCLSPSQGRMIAVLTGPNMAGKSTYLRTAALLSLMAHMGAYVPAESAHVCLLDRIFTRIGARDELTRGQSTFMVEMVETANILRHLTERSLVVLDEVGRGTSTYDGMSIAWAVLEFLHGHPGRPRVLFATHYHELTELADRLPGVVNLSMAVEETERGVLFLHKVVAGRAGRSYGIEVARLAGVPQAVLSRSRELLATFEEQKERVLPENVPSKRAQQTVLFETNLDTEAIVEEIAQCDLDSMTPLAALETLYRLKKRAKRVERKGSAL